jgi:hypothetical protein
MIQNTNSVPFIHTLISANSMYDVICAYEFVSQDRNNTERHHQFMSKDGKIEQES